MSNVSNLLHSADAADPLWLDSSLSSKYRSRLELCETLSRAEQWKDICGILNEIPQNDIRSLATVLNDCPRWARKIALAQLRDGPSNTHYLKCIDAISDFQINRAYLDPEDLFPYVTTDLFIRNLNMSADRCPECKHGFEVGDDIIAKHCRRHWKANRATAAFNIPPIFDCIAKNLAPADITNMLVALGHVPTEAWRRRFMNLFRQLPEYGDWIAQMAAKHYTMVLVGDIKRLGLYVSNSHKYGISQNPIVVWLAVVPVSACWRNHQDILMEPNIHPDALWTLHPNGELYKRAHLNSEETAMLDSSKVLTRGCSSIAQRNMFATPMIKEVEKDYLTHVTKFGSEYERSESGWVMRKDSWGSPIITVFYEGLEDQRGHLQTIAYLGKEHTAQSWKNCAFHPPLIKTRSELDPTREPKLYYYRSTDMKVKSSHSIRANIEALWHKGVTVKVMVTDILGQKERQYFINLPIDK